MEGPGAGGGIQDGLDPGGLAGLEGEGGEREEEARLGRGQRRFEGGGGGGAVEAEGVEMGLDTLVEVGEGAAIVVGGARGGGAVRPEEGDVVDVPFEEVGSHGAPRTRARVFLKAVASPPTGFSFHGKTPAYALFRWTQ